MVCHFPVPGPGNRGEWEVGLVISTSLTVRTLQHAEMAEHNVSILFYIVKISLWMNVWGNSDETYYYVYTREV